MKPGPLPLAAAVLLFAAGGVAAAQSREAPSPTPTPRPRLSGGFGRPRAVPLPSPTASVRAPEDLPGQGLADLVKAASDTRSKREGTAKSGIAITNQTLVKDPEKGRLTVYSGTADPGKGGSPSRTTLPTAADEPPAASVAGDETYWRETARAARARVEELQGKIAELEAAAKRLENDFYSWDDGQYRDRVIKPAWDRTREDLETAKEDLEAAQKDLEEMPDRARKAGALPGWLRE